MSCRLLFHRACLLLVAALAYGAPSALFAQDSSAPAPPHVAAVEGAAALERDGRLEPVAASTPLIAGDRLRTDDGRVEILLPDLGTVFLDRFTTLDILSESLLRLLDGRVALLVPRGSAGLRIDAAAASVRTLDAGEYRVAAYGQASEAEVDLTVARGAAEIVNDRGSTTVRAGERSVARRNTAPTPAFFFNAAAWDPLGVWIEERRSDRIGSMSSRYLPPALQPYAGTFDRHGTWRHAAAYGHVWYPYVASSWRPYFNGRWRHVRAFGWTWIGFDPWVWPTHHYGRWGFQRGAWFWIPAPHWAPAWVSWAVAPGFVGWCPLGFDGRPVFPVGVVAGGRTPSVYDANGLYDARGLYDANGAYDPWQGWTIVPRDCFGMTVADAAVVAGTLGSAVRSRFTMQGTPPLAADRASARTPDAAAAADPAPPGQTGRALRSPRPPGVTPPVAVPRFPAPRVPAPFPPPAAPRPAPGLGVAGPVGASPAEGAPPRALEAPRARAVDRIGERSIFRRGPAPSPGSGRPAPPGDGSVAGPRYGVRRAPGLAPIPGDPGGTAPSPPGAAPRSRSLPAPARPAPPPPGSQVAPPPPPPPRPAIAVPRAPGARPAPPRQ